MIKDPMIQEWLAQVEDSPIDTVVEEWEYRGAHCLIVFRILATHTFHCGYARFDFPMPDDDDVLDTIKVHGGVTFDLADEDAFLIGFDCAHLGDDDPGSPTHDVAWVKQQVEGMVDQVMDQIKPPAQTIGAAFIESDAKV